jgi:hypothetical protein
VSLKSIVAILIIATVPVCAQAQNRSNQSPLKPTKADVQRVAQTISGDKAKMQQYCDLGKLDNQIADAEGKKDTKKVAELSQKADETMKKMGAEYLALADTLQQVGPNSKEGQEMAAAFEDLDKQCAKK